MQGSAERWTRDVRSLPHLRELLRVPRAGPRMFLDIFRHGETLANAGGRISGAADVALSERGRSEGTALGGHLDGTYAIAFHSPLSRSRETLLLGLAASGADVDAIIEDPRIAERSMGVLEGEPARPLPAYDRGDLRWAPAGGEPYAAVLARVLSFLVDLQDLARQMPADSRFIVCTHAGPMRVLLGVLAGSNDARAVLTGSYANATISYVVCRELAWPPFAAIQDDGDT